MTTWTPRPVSALRMRGERRDEGLALAGPHLGDLALVEDGAADELDVEVAHPERALASPRGPPRRPRAGRRRGAFWRRSFSRLRRAFASSRRRSSSGWLSSSSDGSSGRRPRGSRRGCSAICVADLVVGQGLELGLEGVDLVDQRLEPSDLAVVRVDESGKEASWDDSIG